MSPWRSQALQERLTKGYATSELWEGILVIGINSTAVSAEISPGYITRKALTVFGVVRYLPEYLHKSLEFLEKYQDKYPFKEFSERKFSLDEIGEALQMSADRKITRAIIVP